MRKPPPSACRRYWQRLRLAVGSRQTPIFSLMHGPQVLTQYKRPVTSFQALSYVRGVPLPGIPVVWTLCSGAADMQIMLVTRCMFGMEPPGNGGAALSQAGWTQKVLLSIARRPNPHIPTTIISIFL